MVFLIGMQSKWNLLTEPFFSTCLAMTFQHLFCMVITVSKLGAKTNINNPNVLTVEYQRLIKIGRVKIYFLNIPKVYLIGS
jgi:hypothetical protein